MWMLSGLLAEQSLDVFRINSSKGCNPVCWLVANPERQTSPADHGPLITVLLVLHWPVAKTTPVEVANPPRVDKIQIVPLDYWGQEH